MGAKAKCGRTVGLHRWVGDLGWPSECHHPKAWGWVKTEGPHLNHEPSTVAPAQPGAERWAKSAPQQVHIYLKQQARTTAGVQAALWGRLCLSRWPF